MTGMSFKTLKELQEYINSVKPLNAQWFYCEEIKSDIAYSPWESTVDRDGVGVYKHQITGRTIVKLGCFKPEGYKYPFYTPEE